MAYYHLALRHVSLKLCQVKKYTKEKIYLQLPFILKIQEYILVKEERITKEYQESMLTKDSVQWCPCLVPKQQNLIEKDARCTEW